MSLFSDGEDYEWEPEDRHIPHIKNNRLGDHLIIYQHLHLAAPEPVVRPAEVAGGVSPPDNL